MNAPWAEHDGCCHLFSQGLTWRMKALMMILICHWIAHNGPWSLDKLGLRYSKRPWKMPRMLISAFETQLQGIAWPFWRLLYKSISKISAVHVARSSSMSFRDGAMSPLGTRTVKTWQHWSAVYHSQTHKHWRLLTAYHTLQQEYQIVPTHCPFFDIFTSGALGNVSTHSKKKNKKQKNTELLLDAVAEPCQ